MGKQALILNIIKFRFILLISITVLMLGLPSLVKAAGYSTHPSMLDAAQRYEGGDQLESIWDIWSNGANPDNRSKTARNKQRELFLKTAFSDDLKINSHHYYILEAKMGLSHESKSFDNSYLSKNNTGLSAFRAGVKAFFMDKDYSNARRAFAKSILLSAKLNNHHREQLQQLTALASVQPVLENESDFIGLLTDYFIGAEVMKQNDILNYIDTINLPDKDLLNLFWALGGFIATNNQFETAFNESQLNAENRKSLYLKLRNKFEFATASHSIWFPWY